MDQAARHAQVVGAQVGAAVVARHAEFEFLAFAQQQETAFRARHRQRRVHQRRQNVGRGEGGLQRARQFHHRAQPGKLAAGRGGEPFGDPLHAGVRGGEDQAVGIGDAEFDAIGGSELPPPDTVAVDEDSVAAIQVFDEVVAAFGQDARMRAGDSGVPQDQVAAGCLPIEKGSGSSATRLRAPEGSTTNSSGAGPDGASVPINLGSGLRAAVRSAPAGAPGIRCSTRRVRCGR